ncbi:MAG TPA: MASE1 domain-containing protein [Roseimicrobium sp.]|nr:MASE1 domain-containing protein [Roseimicrobium sp.]
MDFSGSRKQFFLRNLFLALAYVAGGKLGLILSDPQTNITLIWPATGIAVAGLYRWGSRCWPAVFIGAFVVEKSLGYSLSLSTGIAIGNTLAPWLAVHVLRRMEFVPSFERKEGGLQLIGAALLGMVISGAGGALNLCLHEFIPWSAFFPALLGWWLGDSAGVLLIAPLLLSMSRIEWDLVRRRKWEFSLIFWAVVAASAFVFLRIDAEKVVWGRLAFLTLPLMVWGSLRFGPIGAAISSLQLSAMAAAATAVGLGPFYGKDMQHGGFLLWAFTVTTAFTGLMINSLQAERKRAEMNLQSQRDLLEAIRQIQSRYIIHGETRSLFEQMAQSLVLLTGSRCSCIGEVLQGNAGDRLNIRAKVNFPAEKEPDAPDPLDTVKLLSLISGRGTAIVANDRLGLAAMGIWSSELEPPGSLVALPMYQSGVLMGVAVLAGRHGGYDPELCRELEPLLAASASLIDCCHARQREVDGERLRRRLEEHLRQAQKMEAIGQLAGGVAHDFNNILTVIQGNATQLQTIANSDPAIIDPAKQIMQASDRAAALTRQLLFFGRKQTMQAVDLDLNEVIAQMVWMLRPVLGKEFTLDLELAPSLPRVRADNGMIEQVLLNLVVNARDAMPTGGRITMRTSVVDVNDEAAQRAVGATPGKRICFKVIDTGTGIPPEVLPRIFEPFFTTKEEGKGTGLGLASVFGIIQQHHGWIEVESKFGHGTTFSIHLPPSAGANAAANSMGATGGSQPGQVAAVLVVEEDSILRNLTVTQLERGGYTVFEAASGVEALRIWELHLGQVRVLLTDLILTDGVGGRDLAACLRVTRPDLAVIYTSEHSPSSAGKDLLLREGYNFLAKPYAGAHLIETVAARLDSSNS